jgi:hypothetical protein
MATKTRGSLIDTLKEHRTAVKYVVAIDEEDERKKIAVPDVRNRWLRVGNVLADLKWARVELYNKADELLGVHERNEFDEEPAGNLEDLSPPPGANGVQAQSLAIACHWIVRAQDMALSRHERAMSGLFDAQARLIDSTVKRFEALDRQYADMMRLNHSLSGSLVEEQLGVVRRALASAAAKAGADESESGKLLDELLPAFLKAALDKPEPEDKKRRDKEGERREAAERRAREANGHSKEHS